VLIVDAGPLYAVADRSDSNHAVCDDLLVNAAGPLVVPELVVAEVAYLVGNRLGAQAEVALAQSITDGELTVEPVLESEWSRIAELVEQYSDLPLGMADASVIALAERHNAREIATLDRRHFHVVRPKHVDGFVLLP
jgi:uncharacterized protein